MSLVVQKRQTDNATILSCMGRMATHEDANQLLDAYWETWSDFQSWAAWALEP
jgi:hypothetical protein